MSLITSPLQLKSCSLSSSSLKAERNCSQGGQCFLHDLKGSCRMCVVNEIQKKRKGTLLRIVFAGEIDRQKNCACLKATS